MKGSSHFKPASTLVKLFAFWSAIIVFSLNARSQAWGPHYSYDQLDVINSRLEKWKQSHTYTKIEDVFHERSFKLDWNEANQNAEPWDLMPYAFPDESAARKAGGHCDYVKDLKRKTCLFRVNDGQGVLIFVYDQDAAGKFVKNGVIAPDTWYGIASVQFLDALGPGKPKFVLIEHQGDHGTGIDERIHWLLGWHDGAFRTVFRETVYLWNTGLGEGTVYRSNYKFVKGKNPRIELQSTYDLVAVTADPYDFHSQWRDWLFWNEKNFSFYDRRIQKENGDFATSYGNEFKFRQQLENKRLEVLNLPPLPVRQDLDNEFDKQLEKIDKE